MTELLEGVGIPDRHSHTDPNCPFCTDPETKTATYVTYAGEANDSTLLASNLKAGKADRGSEKDTKCRFAVQLPRAKPKFAISIPEGTRTFTFQAHHAISGHQAMKGHEIEHWILARRGKIAADTGYSINSPVNGVWLPSQPQEESWNALNREQKREFAYLAIHRCHAQWHLGHHRIPITEEDRTTLLNDRAAHDTVRYIMNGSFVRDMTVVVLEAIDIIDPPAATEVDDADAGDAATAMGTYDAWLNEQLASLCDHIQRWQHHCDHSHETDGKPHVNEVANQLIDVLSIRTTQLLTTPALWKDWNRFVSRLAWEYSLLASAVTAESRGAKPSSEPRTGTC